MRKFVFPELHSKGAFIHFRENVAKARRCPQITIGTIKSFLKIEKNFLKFSFFRGNQLFSKKNHNFFEKSEKNSICFVVGGERVLDFGIRECVEKCTKCWSKLGRTTPMKTFTFAFDHDDILTGSLST